MKKKNWSNVAARKMYCDPGHGWLAVKVDEIQQLGITNKITGYSYYKGATVYLEEDCDLETYMTACRKAGYNPRFVVKHCDYNSPIRSYNRVPINFVDVAANIYA